MMRPRTAILLLCALPAWAQSEGVVHPTAVFTLDVARRTFPTEPGARLDLQFRQWAQSCKLAPKGPLHVLECPDVPAEAAGIREQVTVAVALFRDLNEVLYVAGCPRIEDPAKAAVASEALDIITPEAPADKREEKLDVGLRLPDARDCLRLEAGQTFSAEVENDEIRIVIRGRQLPLTLLEARPKPLALGDPRSPKISANSPTSRPAGGIDPSQLPEQPEPKWSPPPLREGTGTVAKAGPGSGVAGAKTDLRTGRFVIECAQGPAQVYIDDAYMGACPVDTPLIAGEHEVTVRVLNQEDWVREFRVEAGETVRLKAERGKTGQ
jgi:hypothetical protein